MAMSSSSLVVAGDISHLIHIIRGQRVILDLDLARLYDVPTKRLNEQVKRNQARFPEDFTFQLSQREVEGWLRSRSQFATLKRGVNIKYRPHAFTEHGAIMAANVLNSARAVAMSVEVVRAFVRLRRMALSVETLARKIDVLERRYDSRFRVVFNTIRQLMASPESPKRRIGFQGSDSGQ